MRRPNARARRSLLAATAAVASGGALAILAACSTFGAEAQPTSDGGADAASDGASATDATVDGGSAGDGPFCPRQTGATFCADFDYAATVDNGWRRTELIEAGGGHVTFDETAPVSPPRAAEFVANTHVDDGSSGAFLVLKAGAAPVTCNFEWNVVARGVASTGSAVAYAAGFALVSPSPSATGFLSNFLHTVDGDGTVRLVVDASDGGASPSATVVAANVTGWHHVSFHVTQTTYDVSFDGDSRKGTHNPANEAFDVVFEIGAGSFGGPQASPWTFRYDDVVCFAK